MVVLDEVSKSFNGHKAVDNVSLHAREKEITVLLGTSGCGKTTTLKMVNRLIEPDSGTISINGKNIKDANPVTLRRAIGFVMQNAGLFPHYTVARNIAILPELLKWDKKTIQNRTITLLEKLNLQEGILSRYPHELSGGQQQRVGIARALIADPQVLLMDEPFGALDAITKAAIHREFRSLEELTGKTTLLVTHDVQEAFELGHRICLMDKGRIIQSGTPREILYHPANDFVKEFFASNRLILEYKIASISDIRPYLKSVLPLKTNESVSVWQALQDLSTNNTDSQQYTDLVQAFALYRKTQGI
jgi:osmoprotectant transport system ATP-binding protein